MRWVRFGAALGVRAGSWLWVVACGASTSGSSQVPAVDSGADAAVPAACTATSACSGTTSGGGVCVTTLDATLVDPQGHPIAGVPVFACGTNLCTEPSPTGADGHAHLAPCVTIERPALKVFDDPTWAPFAAGLLGAGPAFTIATLTVAPLPAQGSLLASGTNASAGVTLVVTGAVKFDLEHTTAPSRAFRAARVTPAWFSGTGLDPAALVIEVAWSLAPLNAILAPAAKLTVPNAAMWPAGAQVDFFLDGTDATTATPFAPWGTWGAIGSGHVSADGLSVSTDDGSGNGLPEVGLVGLRLH